MYRSHTKTGASFALDSEIAVVAVAVGIEQLQKLKLWVHQTNSCYVIVTAWFQHSSTSVIRDSTNTTV